MTPEELLNRLRQVPDQTLIELCLDVRAWGTGFLRIDGDGSIRHVPLWDAYEKPEATDSATNETPAP